MYSSGALARRIRASFLAASCAALASGCSGQGTIPPPTASQTLSQAAGSVQPAAAALSAAENAVIATAPSLQDLGVKDAGPAAPDTSLTLALTLAYRNQAKLDRLVAQQTDRRSARYGRWLSNAAFNATYAPSESDYERVVDALRAAGFRIDTVYANRTVVDATATVGTIDRYFRTSIHRVEQSGQGERYANVRPAYAPVGLGGLLLSLDGLDTVVVVHSDHVLLARGGRQSLVRPMTAQSHLFGPVSTVTGAFGYGPLAFSVGYDLPTEHADGTGKPYDGLGRASGIVIDADFAESDLRAFLTYFDITRTGPATKRVLINGGPPKGDAAADSVEAVLDAEALVGDAPGTALSVYEIPKLTNADIADAFNKVVSENAVDTVNASFGGCEADIGTKTVEALNAIAEQGAAKGITFHASSGDGGGSLCANAPASLLYVAAVGGTTLTVGTGGTWASEAGWSDSGGGISTVFALPAWQKGVAGTVDRGRNVPDVALDADPETGIAFYYQGSWNTQYNPLGGTSLSSPIFGAAVTEIDQVKKGRVGLQSSALFGLLAAHGYGSSTTTYFHDIVQGNSGVFYAGPGYDLVTGIGSVDGWNLAGLL